MLLVCNSPQICGYTLQLIVEFPTILNSFFTNTTSDLYGVVGWGWWGAMEWQAKQHVMNLHSQMTSDEA